MGLGPRMLICAITLLLLLTSSCSPGGVSSPHERIDQPQGIISPTDVLTLSDAGGTGAEFSGVAYMTRRLDGQVTKVLNTYANPSSHTGVLDLNSYLVPSWNLHRVDMEVQYITAIAERAVAGVNSESWDFQITKKPSQPYYINQLAQGFYMKPHNGRLLNFSLFLDATTYNRTLFGTAYFVVRSSPSSSNMTIPSPLMNSIFPATWLTVQSIAYLSANSEYYVIIDGSGLTEYDGVYPLIRWRSQNGAGTYDTRRFDTEYGQWGGALLYEALLRYAYVPWNTTSGSALSFSDPSRVALQCNSTPLSGLSWTFTSAKNITQLRFDSNLSVAVGYSLTLWYSRPITTTTLWNAPTSGGSIVWNQSLTLSYPSIPTGTVSRFVNLTRMTDWTPTGLYLGSSPTNHDKYSVHGRTVVCTEMSDGTWTMVYSAHNYVTSIDASSSVVITDDLLVTINFRDALSVPVSSGSSNLTFWKDTSVITRPANESEPDGIRTYLWNIDAFTTTNGRYRIEVFWANGTEAGYRTRDVVVYYPTDLRVYQSSVLVGTDESFSFSVYYNDTFTPQGLKSPAASVTYSFDGAPYVPMTDLNNGTWKATVSTLGKSVGSYQIVISASGFALQNRTAAIDVEIVYSTLALSLTWTPGSSITYTQDANLAVSYRYANGTSIPNAVVNVTDGLRYWTLQWHPSSGTYNVTLNGLMGLNIGNNPLVISAWKNQHYSRTADTALTISLEPTDLTVSWSPANVTVPYGGVLRLSVDYRYQGGDVPSSGSLVNVTIDGKVYELLFNGTMWTVSIPVNDLGLGTYQATVRAWRYGFVDRTNLTDGIVIIVDTASLTPNWYSYDLYYSWQVSLDVTVRSSQGYLVNGAVVRADLGGTNFTLNQILPGIYRLLLNGSIGLGEYPMRVYLLSYGYTNATVDVTLRVIDTPTTLTIIPHYIGYDGNPTGTLYYDGQLYLVVVCRDIANNPLIGLNVVLVLGTATYPMTDLGNGSYVRSFLGSFLGVGTIAGSASFVVYGYEDQTVPLSVEVRPVPTTMLTDIAIPDVMYFNQTVVVVVEYRNAHTGALIDATYVSASWSNSIPTEVLAPGRYRFTISAQMLSFAIHQLNITIGLENYSYGQILHSITVRPIRTSLSSVLSYTNYEYCNITVQVTYRDLDRDLPITVAIVNMTVAGNVYPMVHVGNGVYRYVFNLTIDPSMIGYTAVFAAWAHGYSANTTSATIIVQPKQRVYIELLPLAPYQGVVMAIGAYVRYNGTHAPLVGVSVTFYISVELDNGTVLQSELSAITSTNGLATTTYDVPPSAVRMTVVARYPGTDSQWKATKVAANIPVQPPSFFILLVRFLTQRDVLLVIALITVVGVVTYGRTRSARTKRLRKRKQLEDQMNNFRDLMSLRHFMAIYLNRGTCVFYHPFTEQKIEPHLVSGFISAVMSVYGEIKGDGVQGTLEEINYQGLRLNGYSGRHIAGILILEGEMTPFLRERLRTFVDLFEVRYDSELDGWTGFTDCFDSKWIVSSLYSVFDYDRLLPHRIVNDRLVKKSDMGLFRALKKLVGDREFRFDDILPRLARETGMSEPLVLDHLLRMRGSGAIAPLEVEVPGPLPLAHPDQEIGPIETATPVTEPEVRPTEPQPEPGSSNVTSTEAETVSVEAEEPIAPPGAAEKQVVPEPPVEPQPQVVKPSEEEAFVMEVEALLRRKAEEGPPAEAPPEPKKPEDEAEKFVQEVEELLKEEKKKKERSRSRKGSSTS